MNKFCTRENHQWATMFLMAVLIIFFQGCTVVDNRPGRPTSYQDFESPVGKQGVGIESQDIVSMTDKMMRDMLANPRLANAANPPKVVVDATYFKNEGHQAINKKLIIDRLRIELIRVAQGRMTFLARHAADITEHEQSLREEGVVVGQATGRPQSAQYRLTGSIKALSTVTPSSGQRTRYHQITFEMVDLTTQEIVWGGIYEYKKAATEDLIYR